MKKLRWVMDGGFWDLDLSTPVTVDGIARPVPNHPLPLGLSRGTKLSRPKQVDFLQRFMFLPFVPSYNGSGNTTTGGNGLSLERVFALPFNDNWFATVLGQFNLQKLVSFVKETGLRHSAESSWLKNLGNHLSDKSFYALGLCSEFFITPDDTFLVSSEVYGDKKTRRSKAVYHHKFPHHNLKVEAAWPGLFIDNTGTYWDVPSLVEIDFASIASDSGSSYHFCVHRKKGTPIQFYSDQVAEHAALHPGLCFKSGFSVKKNIDIWRSKEGKLKMVQPFDVFLSDPHLSASGILGTVLTASLGDSSMRSQREDWFAGINFCRPENKCALLGDFFVSLSCTAQHGNFQRFFFDLTRAHARLDFPSGSNLVAGAARLAQDLYKSQRPDLEAVQAVCPKVTLSFQQQIFGEFSFRVDSSLAFDLTRRDRCPQVDDTVYSLEYALKVLGSAKAVAWYSSKNREAMVELRFFET